MRLLIFTAALFGLQGCATAREARKWCFKNLDFCVIEVPKEQMKDWCSRVTFLDDGRAATQDTEIYACWDPITRDIAVREDRKCDLLHELSHVDGKVGLEAIGFDWCN